LFPQIAHPNFVTNKPVNWPVIGEDKFINLKMMFDLKTLAKQCPDVTLSIKMGDLVEFGEYLVEKSKQSLEQLVTDANTETYPSPDQVAKILDVDKSTLWRWNKNGYLCPIEVGGKRRYRMSEIKKILEGNK
jgi:hypothetical protein